ncbi:hypothetical protein CAF53_16800 [Sphingobium sp. LB126]|nr:hypothetical protein CAF53_16800 [Sphingobium sp. LB126]
MMPLSMIQMRRLRALASIVQPQNHRCSRDQDQQAVQSDGPHQRVVAKQVGGQLESGKFAQEMGP